MRRASEFRCPTCGGGFVDVAPDFPVDGATFGAISGHCAKGHEFFALVERDTDGTERSSVTPLEPEASP